MLKANPAQSWVEWILDWWLICWGLHSCAHWLLLPAGSTIWGHQRRSNRFHSTSSNFFILIKDYTNHVSIIVYFHRDVGEPLYLTPLINAGAIGPAQSAARVTDPLPGVEGENIESYSGFLTVDEAKDSHMYFWFFPAQVRYTFWMLVESSVDSNQFRRSTQMMLQLWFGFKEALEVLQCLAS